MIFINLLLLASSSIASSGCDGSVLPFEFERYKAHLPFVSAADGHSHHERWCDFTNGSNFGSEYLRDPSPSFASMLVWR